MYGPWFEIFSLNLAIWQILGNQSNFDMNKTSDKIQDGGLTQVCALECFLAQVATNFKFE